MVSKDVRDYIDNNGIDKLYKSCESRFAKVDYWSDQFVCGDLMDEYQLSKALDELTGCYIRFHIIASALESYKSNKELDYKVTGYKKAESDGKKATVSQIEQEARQHSADLRTYRGDFLGYAEACEKGIITIQARLKRLTIEKGAKGIDFTGDTANAVSYEQLPNTATPLPKQPETICKQDLDWS